MTTLIWITCGLIAIVFWLITAQIVYTGVYDGTRSVKKDIENATVKDALMALLIIASGPFTLIFFFVVSILAFLMLFSDIFIEIANKKLFKRN